jgi:hypothetical protein
MRDGVLWPPVLSPAGDGDESGRGLLIVDALAAAWHWYHPPRPQGGKVVWALLTGTEGTDVHSCTCGYEAADADELAGHVVEMITPDDDRDAAGVVHAEAARDAGDLGGPCRCACGEEAPDALALDRHLLAAFGPAGRAGRDGRQHAPAGTDAA